MLLEEESDDLDFELGVDVGGIKSPSVTSMLGSMIASLHGIKEYLTLKIMG